MSCCPWMSTSMAATCPSCGWPRWVNVWHSLSCTHWTWCGHKGQTQQNRTQEFPRRVPSWGVGILGFCSSDYHSLVTLFLLSLNSDSTKEGTFFFFWLVCQLWSLGSCCLDFCIQKNCEAQRSICDVCHYRGGAGGFRRYFCAMHLQIPNPELFKSTPPKKSQSPISKFRWPPLKH